MRRLSVGVAALVVALFWWAPLAAQAADSIAVEVMVSQISQEPGKIDPRAARLHAELREIPGFVQ